MKQIIKQHKVTFIFVICFLVSIMIMLVLPYEKLTSFPDLCLWKRFFGFECFGCGTIRAFWKVIHFEFKEAFEINRFIYLYIVMAGIVGINFVKRIASEIFW